MALGFDMKIIAVFAFLIPKASLGLCGAENPATFYLSTPTSISTIDLDNNMYAIDIYHPFKFIIHGWTENANKSHYTDMASTFLSEGNYNIIRVDYSDIAALDYISAVDLIESVGNYTGDFIIALNKMFGIPLENVHVIGHSLGAQVAGFIGRRVYDQTGLKLFRITALDPASPIFEKRTDGKKLTKNDANMVDIIHTDAGVLGYAASLGTVSFFPNGGKRLQPGCFSNVKWENLNKLWNNLMDLYFCSHHQSFIFFTASIKRDFIATKCNSWENYEKGLCKNYETTLFGARTPSSAKRNYYLAIDMAQIKKNELKN